MTDEEYMKMALVEAQKARGATSPNPLVGCVIVAADGTIVGKGYHHRAGEPHAEVNALAAAGKSAKGATAYVTLEPCSHYGRTGPCCEALIKAGIKKVVAATSDPNPKVAGRGFTRMKEAGLQVVVGVLEKQALRQNEVFMHWMTTGKSFVALKYAMTMDGKIATDSGDSKWITGGQARAKAHYLRSIYDGILVGKNTVLKDDPALTCRLVEGKNPLRIILDSKLSLPTTAKVFQDKEAPTLVVCGEDASREKLESFAAETSAKILQVKVTNQGRIDISTLLEKLGEKNITSILVEGGSEIHGAFYDAGEINRVYAFIAPKLIGGAEALPAIGGKGSRLVAEGYQLQEVECEGLGEDLLLTGVVAKEECLCSQD